MRIIQVVNVRWFNATAWYGVELARLGRDAGHPTLVVGLEGTDPLQRAQDLGLDTLALPLNATSPFAMPGLYRGLRKLQRDFRPDVINCHRGESFALWSLLKGRRSEGRAFALVRTRGDQRPPRADPLNRLLHGVIADAVIATNSRMAAQFRQRMRMPEERLYTILGGVDTRRFTFDGEARRHWRAVYGYGEQDRVVGLLGRFDTVKGQLQCIQAIAMLVRQNPAIRLLLLGFDSATREETVRGWISEAGLQDRVRITGRVEDVPGHLSALDLGVISSLWSETIARAALELMACGLPVVSTDVGVMPDLLSAAALCPPGDVAAMAALIARGVEDPDFAGGLRRANRERMRGLTSERFWAETLHVYERALQRARHA